MLLRTASTPALAVAAAAAWEKSSEFPVAAELIQELQPFNAGARRVQSESDLQQIQPAAASCTAAAFSRFDQEAGSSSGTATTTTTPKRQWSRRFSLRRGSSLPAKLALHSILDQASLPGLAESAADEDDEDTAISEARNVEAASGSHGFGVPESSVPISLSIPGFGRQPEKIISVVPGDGVGVGSTGGRSKTGFNGGRGSESDGMDAYYLRMIREDPSNSLLLRNYAKYLHEVKGELSRAEEFYERAILAAPDDPEVRSQYAKLIWEFRQDEERAACYFEQAARDSPDNCDVLGAYAAFLWDVDEEQDNPSLVPLTRSAVVSV